MNIHKLFIELCVAAGWGGGGGGGRGPCLPFIYYSVRNEEGPGIRLYSL